MNEGMLYTLTAAPSAAFEDALAHRLAAIDAPGPRGLPLRRLAAGALVVAIAAGAIAAAPPTRAALGGVLTDVAGVTFFESDTIGSESIPGTATGPAPANLVYDKAPAAEIVARIPDTMLRPPAELFPADPNIAGVSATTPDGKMVSYQLILSASGTYLTLSADTRPSPQLIGQDAARKVEMNGERAALVRGGWNLGVIDANGQPTKDWAADPKPAPSWQPGAVGVQDVPVTLYWVRDGVQYALSGNSSQFTDKALMQIAESLR